MYSPRPFPMRVRVSIGPRDPERFPVEDDPLGHALNDLVTGVIAERGKLPRPAALAFHSDRVEQYDLAAILQAKGDAHRFLSAVAGQPGVDAVALVGVLGVRFGRSRRRPNPPRTPAVIAFVEWPDCRWWSAIRPLEERKLRDDWPPMFRAAVDGYPRPGGLGGWFSRARREGLRLQMHGGLQQGTNLVH